METDVLLFYPVTQKGQTGDTKALLKNFKATEIEFSGGCRQSTEQQSQMMNHLTTKCKTYQKHSNRLSVFLSEICSEPSQ